jgi:hypothetical protein
MCKGKIDIKSVSLKLRHNKFYQKGKQDEEGKRNTLGEEKQRSEINVKIR